MPVPLAAVAFFGGTGFILAGSRLLPHTIDGIARRLGAPPAYTGLLTALGANSPEVATALAAMITGAKAVGYGVVLGSNLFNLAGLLGLAAIVAGSVGLPPRATAVHGGVGLLVTIVGVVLVAGYLAPWLAAALIGALFLPYVVLMGLPRPRLEALPLPERLLHGLVLARGGEMEVEEQVEEEAREEKPLPPRRVVAAHAGASLLLIVAGSVGLLEGARRLGDVLGVPEILVGSLVLAFLSGLPNLYTAVLLGLRGRGRAVVAETLNSNTLNVVVGISVPALIFGVEEASSSVRVEAWWLLGLTVLALALTGRRSRLGRVEGAVVVVAYLVFVGVRVAVT